MWYRFTIDVPADAKGKTVKLYAPAIETEAWGWVNGTYVGHRPYREAYERPNEIDFDVTAALKPGVKNVIALRTHRFGSSAASRRDDFASVFVCAEKIRQASAAPARPVGQAFLPALWQAA